MAKGGARGTKNSGNKSNGNNKDKSKLTSSASKAVRSSSKAKPERSPLDMLKWALVVIGVVAGIYANMHYSSVALGVRAAIGIVVFLALLALAAWTKAGGHALGFIKSARGELRKVVWPTRQETLQTTLIVAVVVLVTALVLWGLDSLLLWVMGWVTGQRG